VRTTSSFFFLFGISACSPQYGVNLDASSLDESVVDAADDEEGTEVEEEDEEEEVIDYSGASIRIVSPASGDFLPFGETHSFEARVQSPDGLELPVELVVWNSDADDAWGLTGSTFDDDSIDVGTHNITAEVALPDGSRLAHTVGGVLVQHEFAGTYVGDMILSLDASYGETPIGTSCIGAAIVVVDTYGETATGSSACTLDLLGYATFDVDHTFNYEFTDTDLDGSADVAIPFLGDLPFSSEGSLEDETIVTAWEGGITGGFELAGILEVDRITREVTEL
jgi:hypothetical protein